MNELPWLTLFLSLLDAAPRLLQLWGHQVTSLPLVLPWVAQPLLSRPPSLQSPV